MLVVFAQLLLREGARNKTTSLAAILAPSSISGYLLMGCVILAMIFAMQKLPLRTVTAWNSLAYILTPLAARVLLKDPLSPRMAIAALLIVAGIVVFSL